jgi:hypothetical protein
VDFRVRLLDRTPTFQRAVPRASSVSFNTGLHTSKCMRWDSHFAKSNHCKLAANCSRKTKQASAGNHSWGRSIKNKSLITSKQSSRSQNHCCPKECLEMQNIYPTLMSSRIPCYNCFHIIILLPLHKLNCLTLLPYFECFHATQGFTFELILKY